MSTDINALLTLTKDFNKKFQLRLLNGSQFMLIDLLSIDYYNNQQKLIDYCYKLNESIFNSKLIKDADIIGMTL